MPQIRVLASERRQVEVQLGAAEQVGRRAVVGIGVQDGVAVAGEDADAALLAGPGEEVLPGLDQFLLGLVVVLDGRDFLSWVTWKS
jgi:hypothetical protein